LGATDYALAVMLFEHAEFITMPWEAKVSADEAIAWAERVRALALAQST
jgi:hypothetical protein